MRLHCYLLLALALTLCSCRRLPMHQSNSSSVLTDDEVAVLNHLRNEIDFNYGDRDGTPRINLGPCGRFAKAFREEWNARFPNHINIVFVMSPDGTYCHHVLVKLPD